MSAVDRQSMEDRCYDRLRFPCLSVLGFYIFLAPACLVDIRLWIALCTSVRRMGNFGVSSRTTPCAAWATTLLRSMDYFVALSRELSCVPTRFRRATWTTPLRYLDEFDAPRAVLHRRSRCQTRTTSYSVSLWSSVKSTLFRSAG